MLTTDVTLTEVFIGPPWMWGLAALAIVWYGAGWLAFHGWEKLQDARHARKRDPRV